LIIFLKKLILLIINL